MKQLHYFFLLVFFSVPTFALAQNTDALENHNDNSIYLQRSFFNYKYVKNGIYYRVGFMGNKLKKELEVHPNAIGEFKKYQNNELVGNLLIIAGFSLLQVAVLNDNDNQGIFYASTGGLLLGSILNVKAQNHLNRSIWLYNQNLKY